MPHVHIVGTMGGVCRLWSQHIAVNEPLRSQTCQAKFANRRCVCEPSNRVSEPPVRSLGTMTGVCEPNQVSRTRVSRIDKVLATTIVSMLYEATNTPALGCQGTSIELPHTWAIHLFAGDQFSSLHLGQVKELSSQPPTGISEAPCVEPAGQSSFCSGEVHCLD